MDKAKTETPLENQTQDIDVQSTIEWFSSVTFSRTSPTGLAKTQTSRKLI